MVDVAQSVRVADCGSVGRGFESHLPPNYKSQMITSSGIFCSYPFTSKFQENNQFFPEPYYYFTKNNIIPIPIVKRKYN